MFDETLLDSAPAHAPVLKSVHWIIALAAAVVGYVIGYFGLPLLTAAEEKVVITQAIILGVLIGCWPLMLCYIWADCRHFGFSAGIWVALLTPGGAFSHWPFYAWCWPRPEPIAFPYTRHHPEDHSRGR